MERSFKFLLFVALCMFVPIGSLDFINIKNEDDSCIQAFGGLKASYLAFPEADPKSVVRYSLNLWRKAKQAYNVCIIYSISFHTTIKKALTQFPSISAAFEAFIHYVKSNPGNSALAAQELISAFQNKDAKKIQYIVQLVLDALLKDNIQRTELASPKLLNREQLATARGFSLNFLTYSGILKKTTPRACLNRIDSMIQDAFEAGAMIWTLSDILGGIDKIFNLGDTAYQFINSCPETISHWIDLVYNKEWFEFNTLFRNFLHRSGLIGANGYNAYVAIGSKNWPKVGAWVGLMIFNFLSPVVYDDSLLPNVYDQP